MSTSTKEHFIKLILASLFFNEFQFIIYHKIALKILYQKFFKFDFMWLTF